MLAYLSYDNAAAFFHRFNLSTVPYVGSTLPTINVDIATGALLSSYTPPALNATLAALEVWLNQTSKYNNILLPGYWNFPNGSAIPSELLLPFGEFARKYGIEAAIPLMESVSNVGVGGVEDILTLYVMFAFGEPVTQEFLAGSLFSPKDASNSVLYERALQLLRKDVLLRSWVTSAERNNDGVKLVVQSADGCKRLIKAKRMLFTPPPSLNKLAPFDLDSREIDIFSTWTPTWSFAGIARIPTLPGNYSISYIAPAGAPTDYLAIRNWPYTLALGSVGPAGENLFSVLIATNYSVTHAEAKAMVTSAVKNTTSPGGALPANATIDGELDFVAFVDHNSVLWRQSVEQLREGIVQDVYSLQGPRSTWYTGSLWSEDYTGNVWAFTENLLPRLIKSL